MAVAHVRYFGQQNQLTLQENTAQPALPRLVENSGICDLANIRMLVSVKRRALLRHSVALAGALIIRERVESLKRTEERLELQEHQD